jgi:hypothetical protein
MAFGCVVWVTGPEPEACGTVAEAIANRLEQRHVGVERLDASAPGLADVGPGAIERAAAFAAAALARHGVITVVTVPSPRRASREALRAELGPLIEVHVPGPAVAGYEPPDRPEVEADEPAATATRTLRTLEVLGHLAPGEDPAYSAEEERQVIRRLKSFGYL